MDPESGSARSPFSQKILNLGFLTGLGLAALCLVLCGYYMVRFQTGATAVVDQVLADEATAARTPPAASPAEAAAAQQAAENRYRTQRLTLSIHSYIAQTLLLSCGVLVGLAFGFLGFSLFLIGAEGSSDLQLDAPAKLKLQASRLAPGLFVLLCSTILIGVCVTREQTINIDEKKSSAAAAAAPLEAPAPAAAVALPQGTESREPAPE